MRPTFSRDLRDENLNDYFAKTMAMVWDLDTPLRALTVSIMKTTRDGYGYSEPMAKYTTKWSPFK